MVMVVSGCAKHHHMTKRERNTTIGAATGAVVGHVLTDGSTLGTAGGAVVGGMIGHSSR
ncbi:MAG: glycine zipper 2TM domain-containing protein [Plesiomonas sp.]|uniref:glycine zipper 2TM domain-containing protein n=1 Tax=Plesiomonas sp. TaxID=2486279 RepID=UPI003EE50806